MDLMSELIDFEIISKSYTKLKTSETKVLVGFKALTPKIFFYFAPAGVTLNVKYFVLLQNFNNMKK